MNTRHDKVSARHTAARRNRWLTWFLTALLVPIGLNAGYTKFGTDYSLDIANDAGVPLVAWAWLGAAQIAGAVLLVWPSTRTLATYVY